MVSLTTRSGVTLETMLKFNRLNAISSEADVIAAALRKSNALMEVSADGKKVRRLPSKPLPDQDKTFKDDMKQRNIYAVRPSPSPPLLPSIVSFAESLSGRCDPR
jgi:lupus La protein